MIPRFKSEELQGELFPQHIMLRGHGHVRVLLGDFAEALTAKLFNGRRYMTDSRCEYCPDIGTPHVNRLYLEVKTVGKTNDALMYEGRLEKDRKFIEKGNQVLYVLWNHSLSTLDCEDDYELKCMFLRSLKRVLIVPFSEIDRIAMSLPIVRLNTDYGHSRTNPVYGQGRRVPIKKVMEGIHYELKLEFSEELFYGNL